MHLQISGFQIYWTWRDQTPNPTNNKIERENTEIRMSTDSTKIKIYTMFSWFPERVH